MVLGSTASRSRVLLLSAAAGILTAGPAQAQSIEQTAPLLDEPGDFRPIGLQLGSATLYPTLNAQLRYDSNIYAEPANEVDDVVFVANPQVVVERTGSAVQLRGVASANIRRYFDRTTENSVAAYVGGSTAWRFGEASQVTTTGYWQRIVEDRGDPEARDDPTSGPRLIDAYGGEAGYRYDGGRFGFRVDGSATRFDFRSFADAERDHDAYAVSGRVSYRVGALTSVYVLPFYTARDFRLATDTSGVNRDSKTYGARAGINIDTGGFIRGSAAVGVFRFNPEDPTLDARTGISAQASLVYQPTERTALFLEGFRGDVATVRSGASSRVDSRVRLGLQQEIRHNLRWEGSVVYRRTNFVGGSTERTWGGLSELEYRFNRSWAIAATAQYADRDSTDPSDQFERFRGGIELRLRF